MAILINLCSRKKIVVRASHTFGRHPYNVQTLLTCADTSQIHASIRWNLGHWEVIDHSRNGTELDGKRLPCNHWTTLKPGSQIRFAKSEESRWQVINLDPPGTMLFCDPGEASPGEASPGAASPGEPAPHIMPLTARHHLLPDETAPVLAISITDSDGWVLDQGEQRRCLKDGDRIELAGKSWEFVCAPDISNTAELLDPGNTPDLADIGFHFNVSRDEEHVSLKIRIADQIYDLFERVHHYCLLVLARQRQQDMEQGLDPDSRGWIEFEKFSKMLGLDPSHVNIQIFRARHQLIETIPEATAWPNLIERKRGVVRFGPFNFDVVRGSAIQVESH
jgi:hypothetical protein